MQIGKWGNSLAVRLPVSIVEQLGLREGDEVAIEISGDRRLRIVSSHARKLALQRLAQLDWTLPPGLAFSRDKGGLGEG